MEHSKNFESIKKWYDEGVWSKERVHNVVGKKLGITPEEYEEITGEPYEVRYGKKQVRRKSCTEA